ncbi:VRR-NUC domain-containing protein [Yersinia ruckeri]|uniref:VRR-NUC domain-containing protein n=1 Tax=Yersinia ruckeri TaxID=29486 RepID=UPI0020BF9467|nr:VRR-NUC domain-containing protein [Yersinia ruckeri]MCK8586361.1 VRR-NUC domain-containing protein [Yersinia ruckeri]MCW6615602.1 VRR-NUC domain-containing protein [Yersinia ruckeri]
MPRFPDSWYSERCQKGGRGHTLKARKVASSWDAPVKVVRSPHAVALEKLAKNPELIKRNYEHYGQVRFFHHYEVNIPQIYERLHSTPNGGLRAKKTGGNLNAEGLKKGYPDVSLDVARGCYHGMRLEFKHGKNKLTEEQKKWLNILSEDGYYCVVVYGEHEAIEAVTQYWLLGSGASLPNHGNDHLWRNAA